MSRKPVVLQINTVAHGTSPVGRLMRALASTPGIEMHMAAGCGPETDNCIIIGRKSDRYVNALHARLYGDDGYAARSNTRRLLEYVSYLNPDIVHLHNAHGYYLHLPMLTDWLRNRHIPLMVTLHDHWWLTGRCATPSSCMKFMYRRCTECSDRGAYPAVWRKTVPHYKSLHEAACVIVPTQYLASLLPDDINRRIIPNGVGPEFTPETRLKQRTGVIAVAARWTPSKNLDAITRLAENMPDVGFTVVGKTYGHALPANVRILKGPFSAGEMAGLYRNAAVLLSASTCESFGMTVAEALACRTPVVVQQDTAPVELVAPGDGFTVDFHDIYATEKAIRDAFSLTPTAKRIVTLGGMRNAYAEAYHALCDNI